MPFIAALDTLHVTMKFNQAAGLGILGFDFKYNSTPGLTERTNLAVAMHTFWTNQLKPQITSGVQLTEIDVTDLSSASGPTYTLIISPSEAGTHTGAPEPPNVALVVTHRTAQRGRSFRGRTYLWGLDKAQENNSYDFNLTYVGNIVTAMGWLLTAANTAAGIWSVVSRFANNAPRVNAVVTPITAVSADQYMDSQRRRLFGRGQ